MPDKPPRATPSKRRKVFRTRAAPQPRSATAEEPSELKLAPQRRELVPSTAHASAILDDEWRFFHEWAARRNLDKMYLVLALTYWMRVRSRVWTCFLQHPKEFYMIACLHVALKWLGYDEVLKCDFIRDFREVSPVDKRLHQKIEILVLSELDWDL